MKTNVLTDYKEPTNKELDELMTEVLKEAKLKFAIAKTQLNDKIAEEIALAQAKYKAKQL